MCESCDREGAEGAEALTVAVAVFDPESQAGAGFEGGLCQACIARLFGGFMPGREP